MKKSSYGLQSGQAQVLISIIVPVYNSQSFLNECVDSILAQTHQNIEVILVDDGSIDQTGFICDEYARLDARVVVVHKSNGGVSAARNTGLDKAQGEYILFVDADDYIDPDMCQTLLIRILEKNADIAVCGLRNVTRTSVFRSAPPFS